MTFNTGSKKGRQKNTITIKSNDPVNRTSKVFVSAYVEVEFDFEMYGFDFGKIRVDEPVSRNVYVMVKDPSKVQITGLETSSPNLTARQMETEAGGEGGSRIRIEITLHPGCPPGRFNETLKARSNLAGRPEISMRLSGIVEGDISVSPAVLRLDRVADKSLQTSDVQKIQIANNSPDRELNILSVKDPDGRIRLELKTLQKGQKYEIDVSLIEESLGEGNYYRGAIYITTDYPEQETVVVDYNIYSPPQK